MSPEETTVQQPTILVIVGITGDLAKRKLIPALLEIEKAGALPPEFRLVGITRREVKTEEVIPAGTLRASAELYQMDLSDEAAYTRLSAHLASIEKTFSAPAQRLFYLSLPPQASRPVIEMLGKAGLSKVGNTKLLLEKPFGVDLASAEEITASVGEYFDESQVYRIDHFLAKEMAQNLLTFRRANSLFRKTWSSDFIESIDVIATESIGIEGRAVFYEQTGAMRDVLQSHLLQLAALVLMELPSAHDWDKVQPLRAKALMDLRIPPRSDIRNYAKRGQYEGYREEVGHPHSVVETFVSLSLESSDPRWKGVPIRLMTGKGLENKLTEIRVRYRKEEAFESNDLYLRIQPNEGVSMDMWAKRPGYDDVLNPHTISFLYGEHYESLPDAYERVLVDAIRGKRSFFLSSEEVLASWRVVDPIQKHWSLSDEEPVIYPKGSSLKSLIESAE